ncbi:MAG: hypothetical protein Q4C47_02895 [Planctomycetia bacterium]|nr:hypothetical protein [Planctomycetia bacterium]
MSGTSGVFLRMGLVLVLCACVGCPGPGPERSQNERNERTVSGRGQDLGHNPISTPIRTYFLGKEKISFEIQIPHAMQLYQAANGHYPRTAAEFYNEIIVPNQIPLPHLPGGDYYHYDASSGQLTVKSFPPEALPPQDPSLPPGFAP